MRDPVLTFAAAWLFGVLFHAAALAEPPDPALREVWYDPQAVVTVPSSAASSPTSSSTPSEAITDVRLGLGGDCSKPDASWCIAAQPGAATSSSSRRAPPLRRTTWPSSPTSGRTRSARGAAMSDPRSPVYRLSVRAAAPRVSLAAPPQPLIAPRTLLLKRIRPALLRSSRVASLPRRRSSTRTTRLAEGAGSHDIVPSLVFDDGRFTYLRFANNREVPAVFHVLGDGSEALVNVRMEGDLLVVDRISRQLTLRAGSAVVGLWNEAFDPDGAAPKEGTTVSGVARSMKSPDGPSTARSKAMSDDKALSTDQTRQNGSPPGPHALEGEPAFRASASDPRCRSRARASSPSSLRSCR
jgi:type IV secretion system protein VirB9